MTNASNFINSQEKNRKEQEEDGVFEIDSYDAVVGGDDSDEVTLPANDDPSRALSPFKDNIDKMTKIYSELAHKHGIAIDWDLRTVSSIVTTVAASGKEKLFSIMVSKGYSMTRLAFFQIILTSTITLMDKVAARENLESDALELNVTLLEKLFSLMKEIDSIYKEIRLGEEDLLLTREATAIAESQGDGTDEGAGGGRVAGLTPQDLQNTLKAISEERMQREKSRLAIAQKSQSPE